MSPVEIAAAALGAGATFTDLRSGSIPNWLNAAGTAAGLACGWASGGARGAALALAGCAVGFAAFLLFHLLGGLGGGDVKLMAAFGALVGPRDAAAAAVVAAIAGALMASAVLLRRPRAVSIRYAPAITAGAWLALWARR